MIAKRGLVYSMLCAFLLGSVIGVSQPADAASGSISIAPGETKYVSFGACAVGDVLLWDLDISTLSTIFEYWLQTPSGTHTSLYSLTWGKIADAAGEWKLGFSIGTSGFWSATVYYTTYKVTPGIDILTPSESQYVNQAQVTVSGTVDGFADSVAVSLDDVHYDSADLYLGSWTKQVTLPDDGEHTIYAEGTLGWGSYSVKYYDSVSVTLDTVLPEVGVTAPANNSYVAGEVVITWQCSDECGIALTEVKVDLLEWVTADGGEYTCGLSDGTHTVKVRATDLAGNSAVATTTVLSDTADPQVTVDAPNADSKIDKDAVLVTWTGSDALSGIDHYEVKIGGGSWIDVGTDTSYTFTGLEDKWYSVTVKAVDKSGNSEESIVSFGIYTSIWSTNGPYDGIPLFALIAAAAIAAVLPVLLYRRKRGGAAVTTVPEEESAPETAPTRVRTLK